MYIFYLYFAVKIICNFGNQTNKKQQKVKINKENHPKTTSFRVVFCLVTRTGIEPVQKILKPLEMLDFLFLLVISLVNWRITIIPVRRNY